ncbi:hypothetical protein Q1695_014280 [Nippostrongylus brasiliensis]|nr:hypothetical protein Q1695_014280 [Nippostrongylus brasiliensis]
MDEEDDVIVKKRKTIKTLVDSDDDEDHVETEFKVVVCNQLPNTELYRVHFPVRKRDAFDPERQPRIRYKKNVRLMEVRLAADLTSGSFDKAKAERFAQMGAASVKQEHAVAQHKFDEIYEGRAYAKDDFVQFAVGCFRGDTFYISPIAGTFDMHRSLAHLNNAGKGAHDDEEDAGESDTEAAGSTSKQVRVKFARPETERQKKRREASALHREKLIASDSWIPMDVHLKEDPSVTEKLAQMTVTPPEDGDSGETLTTRDLVEQGIICGEKEQIDLTRSELLLSRQRIREMPIHQQVKAQVLKSRVVATDDLAKLVDPSISRSELIDYLKECAHLVQGVWVLQSAFLYHDLTAAHASAPGKLDEYRADLWRQARDLALCLLDAGLPVTRSLLTRCFQINSKDAEDILSSFAVPGNRSWKLRITPDPVFVESPDNVQIVLEERRYWAERWEELQKKIDSTMPSPRHSSRARKNSSRGSPTKSPPTRVRRNSTRGIVCLKASGSNTELFLFESSTTSTLQQQQWDVAEADLCWCPLPPTQSESFSHIDKYSNDMVPITFRNGFSMSSDKQTKPTERIDELRSYLISRMGSQESGFGTGSSGRVASRRGSTGSLMKQSSSTPNLSNSARIVVPTDNGYLKKLSIGQQSDSGIVKDALEVKDSLSEGYWTPRETLKKCKLFRCSEYLMDQLAELFSPVISRLVSQLTTSPPSPQPIMEALRLLLNLIASAPPRARFASNPKNMFRPVQSERDCKDFELDYLDVAKLQLQRMSEDMKSESVAADSLVFD